MNVHVPAFQQRLSDIVAEYDTKLASLPTALSAFNAAGDTLKMAVTVSSTWGNVQIDTGSIYESDLERSLIKSAWRHVYNGLNINLIASAADKKRFEGFFEKPLPFTLENIRDVFGQYILKPRENILRGLAEVFCALDPAYKSHDKVKIGVAGLPKRVILGYVNSYGSYGREQLTNILNALAAYQGRPLVTFQEVEQLVLDENALLETRVIERPQRYGKPDLIPVHARGVRLRRFKNGNGHLFFEKDTLRDINKALAEYYGEVLPDTTGEKPEKPRASTAVSKDLQYYPTPARAIAEVLGETYQLEGKLVLEPSCGCGRFLDAIRKAGATPFGIEVDFGRAAFSRNKGHAVQHANFLEVIPVADFDMVIMNPPFYGRHYAKHVEHALKFLKPGGTLKAILPATARYDHEFMKGRGGWSDLPVGSFSESGTNINTSVLTVRNPER